MHQALALRYDDQFEPEVIKGDLMITNATISFSGLSCSSLGSPCRALRATRATSLTYKVITDTETETRRLRAEATRDTEQLKTNAARELEILKSQIEDERKQRDALAADNAKAKATYEQLRQQVSLLEENLEDISYWMAY